VCFFTVAARALFSEYLHDSRSAGLNGEVAGIITTFIVAVIYQREEIPVACWELDGLRSLHGGDPGHVSALTKFICA